MSRALRRTAPALADTLGGADVRECICTACGERFESLGLRGPSRRECYDCRPDRSAYRSAYHRRTYQPRSFDGWNRQCAVCQRRFVQPRQGRPADYCSKKCGQWWSGFDRRASTAVEYWNRRCESCEDPLFDRGVMLSPRVAAGSATKRFCSPECISYSVGHTLTIHNRSRVPWRECEDCGAEFVGRWNRYRPLCSGCRAAGQRDTWRRKNYKRKVAKRPGVRYSLAEIAERDGCRCHLCGRKVDMGLSGDHKQGPTIDHLIPLSDGGADVPENVALAHRSCNCARGNKGPAQLRLAS